MHIWDSKHLPPSPPILKSKLSVFLIDLTSFPAQVPEHRQRVQAVPLRRSVHGCRSDSSWGGFHYLVAPPLPSPFFCATRYRPGKQLLLLASAVIILVNTGNCSLVQSLPSWLLASILQNWEVLQFPVSHISCAFCIRDSHGTLKGSVSHSLPSTMALKGTESSNS